MKRTAARILAAAAMAAAMTAAHGQEKKALQVQDTNFDGITAEVTEVTRKEGVLTVKTRFRNTGTKPTRVRIVGNWGDADKFYVVAGSNKMLPLRDSQKVVLMTPQDSAGVVDAEIKPGGSFLFWGKYPAPPVSTKKITYMTPHTPPFEDLSITEAP